MSDETRHELATVTRIRDVEPAEIVTGEVLTEEEYRQQAAVRRQGYAQDAVVVGRAVKTAATSTAAKAIARNLLYVPIGVTVVFRRVRDASTNARYERLIRSAEAAGDMAAVLELDTRAEAAKKARHGRRMDWIEVPAKLVKAALWGGGGLFGVLLLIGIALGIADRSMARVVGPIKGAIEFVSLVTWAITAAWLPFVMSLPAIGAGALWWLGRGHVLAGTGWTARLRPDTGDLGAVVTCDSVVLALQHTRIPEIKKAIKDGWIPAFEQPPVRDGRGYWTVVALPYGVTPGMVADQRAILARNLHRAEVEVWPSDAEKVGTGPAGYLDVWIADSGAISKNAPEYPLLHEGTADVFEGVPGGVSPRGDAITIPIVGNNWVTGGMMGQGKSNACRDIMLGCALDPLAQLCVFVFAGNGDFDAYEPRLSRYERGATDDIAAAGLAHLHWLYGEVGRREQRLAELGAKKVTRALAQKHPDLRPIVSLFSECHELFGHKEYGEEAADVAVQVLRRARKTALPVGFDTQSSRKDAIPPKIVELVSVNACFAVKSWRSNDGFLGDGSFAAGIRATELRPTTDRGTSLITGVSDASFELLKWYFIAVDDDTGFDAATEVIARAVANMAPSVTSGTTSPEPLEAPEERDLLEDLDEILGEETVPTADVPALLRDHAPDWRPYRTLNGRQLRQLLLDEHGIKVPSTNNRWPLDPTAVRAELAKRRAGE